MIHDYEKDYYTMKAMDIYGGSFIQALADLARHADSYNLTKIKECWPGYWKLYEDLSMRLPRDEKK